MGIFEKFYKKKTKTEIDTNTSASIIFEKKPRQFGLRGDISFWEYLKEIFNNYNIMIDDNKIEEIIKEEYFKLTGKEMSITSMDYCEKFDEDGMSAGKICGEFWITKAIPILKERLNEIRPKE